MVLISHFMLLNWQQANTQCSRPHLFYNLPLTLWQRYRILLLDNTSTTMQTTCLGLRCSSGPHYLFCNSYTVSLHCKSLVNNIVIIPANKQDI